MVDDAVGALGGFEREQLRDNLRDCVRIGADGAGAWAAAKRTQARLHHLRLLACSRHEALLGGQKGVAAYIHGALLREVEIDDGDIFFVDVLPHVHLGPVGEREDADAFAGVDAAVVEVPQLGALILRVPLSGGVTEGVDALFGAGFFFVAARTAEGCVEAIVREAVEERLRLQQTAAAFGVENDGVCACCERRFVAPHQQLRADGARHLIAKRNHLFELVAGVDVQQREGNFAGEEGLLGEPQHDGGVFADRIEHDRIFELGGDLAQDVDALGLQQLQVAEAGGRSGCYRLRYGFAENG